MGMAKYVYLAIPFSKDRSLKCTLNRVKLGECSNHFFFFETASGYFKPIQKSVGVESPDVKHTTSSFTMKPERAVLHKP